MRRSARYSEPIIAFMSPYECFGVRTFEIRMRKIASTS